MPSISELDAITPDQLRSRGSLKWRDIDPDHLGAWVAEMDFGLSPAVAETISDCVDRAITGYPFTDAEAEMAQATAEFQLREYGWTIEPDLVRPVPDVVEGLRRVVMELTPPDSPVVLHTPVYFPFFTMVERSGRKQIRVPSISDDRGRWYLDLDALEKVFASGVGSFVLCNPWNPTGRSFSRDELLAVAELCHRYDVRVIVDEIHGPLVYPGGIHIPFASLDHPVAERAVTVTAASKMWNTPGLKCGQVICSDPNDLARWDSSFPEHVVGVSVIGVLATAAAYRDQTGWRDTVLAYLTRNRDRVTEMMREHLPEVGHHPAEATYLSWLDFRPLGIERPAELLAEKTGVVLSEGEIYDGPGFARLNFATPRPILDEMLTRIGDVIGA